MAEHEYSSYKEITETPERHRDFLRVVNAHIENNSADYYTGLKNAVKVNGEAFSQARHLTVLESQSDRWDFDETDNATKREIANLSHKIKAADPGYDLPHFTTGFDYMVSTTKARTPAEVFKEETPENAVKERPELAPAYAYMRAHEAKAEADGLNKAECALVMARVRENVTKSIEKGEIPSIKIKEAAAQQNDKQQDLDR